MLLPNYRDLLKTALHSPYRKDTQKPSDLQPLYTNINSACGDTVNLYLHSHSNDQAYYLYFHCQSCMLCHISTALLCQNLAGAPKQHWQRYAHWLWEGYFHQKTSLEQFWKQLPSLKVFRTILLTQPVRAQCILLPWKTLLQGLKIEVPKKGKAATDGAKHGE